MVHRTSTLGQPGRLNTALLQSLVGHPHRATLLHFWSATAPETLSPIRSLREWHERYQPHGLAVLGVHVPEYAFARDTAVIEAAARRAGIAWPVVNDTTGEIATRFRHGVSPHVILLDPGGHVLHDHIGDELELVETQVRTTLELAGGRLSRLTATPAHRHRFGTLCHPSSPTFYLGHERAVYKNLDPIVIDTEATYHDPGSRAEPGAALAGSWYVGEEMVQATATGPGQYLAAGLSGVTAAIVARSATPGAALTVQLGDQPLPHHLWGDDLVASGPDAIVAIDEPRIYQVLRSRRLLSGVELRLYPRSPHIELYAVHTSGCSPADR